ncbi:efflux RND transporter periplasmic adaptor subunit [Acinetobacter larvae]|uniref:Multidrug transporter subunit MdtA n=1 Tax=Acinetobacter larvae TaxID=1789224 RepID=A0A1B2LZU4_9GAMM|nr:efflux RND transporter periplasmic adaptor subunit [Acinetobacter larvae]AOA58466.1 multidrug transporter subunit MdtA [Acinetobacter larvae]
MSEQPLNLEPQTSSRRGKLKWLIAILLLIGLAALAWNYWQKSKAQKPQSYSQWAKPVPVRVTPVVRGDMQLQIKAIGTVVPAQVVNVQSQVSGVLQQLYFQEGQQVNKGQLLAQIDPAPFQVALAQAQGNLQQNIAQLNHAQTELSRYQLLYKQDSIAKQQLDQQQATVNQLKGQIQANQAQVDAAKLQLSYTKIYAPVAGRAGFRQKDVGNLVQANDSTALLSITQVHPIYVQFAVAENYLDVVRAQNKLQALTVSAWDRSESKQLAVGRVQALDNQIDLTTGTLKLKAVFENNDDVLFPNQFVNVRLNAQTIQNAVQVPSDAIQRGAKGDYVYIINKDNKAEIRMLKLGLSSQGKTQVLSGINANERVVLEGIDRLSEGKEAQIVQDDTQTAASAVRTG